MLAWGEELVPLVDGGEVWSVHDGVFLHQAQPAAVGGGVEVGIGGQRLPRDAEGAVAILELPDMTSQTGVNPFSTVFEAGLVVPVPHFEGVGREADVRGVRLALLLHLGLVQDVGVLAPCPLDWTVDRAPPAVAVAVLGQLALEHLVLAEYLVVVGGDNLGEVGLGPVRELDRVPVEGRVCIRYPSPVALVKFHCQRDDELKDVELFVFLIHKYNVRFEACHGQD